MLSVIGLVILLLSASFVGGSVVVPVTMAVVGLTLMKMGRRTANGTKENAES